MPKWTKPTELRWDLEQWAQENGFPIGIVSIILKHADKLIEIFQRYAPQTGNDDDDILG